MNGMKKMQSELTPMEEETEETEGEGDITKRGWWGLVYIQGIYDIERIGQGKEEKKNWRCE